MLAKTILGFATVLAATVSAITITQPTAGAQWDFSGTNTIEWTSVSTDPTTFSIVLVNHGASNISQTTIAPSVNTADLKYSFTNFVATPDSRYQIWFIGIGQTNSGSIAQSQEFNVTKSGTAPTSTSAGSTASSTSSGAAAASTSAKSGGVSLAVAKAFGFAGPVLGALFLML